MELQQVWEKPVPMAVVEQRQKATRRPKTPDPASPQLRQASRRGLLLVAQQATLRRALVALPE